MGPQTTLHSCIRAKTTRPPFLMVALTLTCFRMKTAIYSHQVPNLVRMKTALYFASMGFQISKKMRLKSARLKQNGSTIPVLVSFLINEVLTTYGSHLCRKPLSPIKLKL